MFENGLSDLTVIKRRPMTDEVDPFELACGPGPIRQGSIGQVNSFLPCFEVGKCANICEHRMDSVHFVPPRSHARQAAPNRPTRPGSNCEGRIPLSDLRVIGKG